MNCDQQSRVAGRNSPVRGRDYSKNSVFYQTAKLQFSQFSCEQHPPRAFADPILNIR